MNAMRFHRDLDEVMKTAWAVSTADEEITDEVFRSARAEQLDSVAQGSLQSAVVGSLKSSAEGASEVATSSAVRRRQLRLPRVSVPKLNVSFGWLGSIGGRVQRPAYILALIVLVALVGGNALSGGLGSSKNNNSNSRRLKTTKSTKAKPNKKVPVIDDLSYEATNGPFNAGTASALPQYDWVQSGLLQGNPSSNTPKTHSTASARSHQHASSAPHDLIHTANLLLRVRKYGARAAANRAKMAVQGLGGYVISMRASGKNPTVNVAFAVPAAQYAKAVAKIEALPSTHVLTDDESSQDVTLKVVDLGSRLKSLRLQRDQLQKLFLRAGSITDTIRIHRVLARVQGRIEQAQGRIRYLGHQVAMSTIHAIFQPKRPKPPKHNVRQHSKPHHPNPLVKSFGMAGNGMVKVIGGAIITIGYAIPLAGIMLILYAVFLGIRRFGRRERRPQTAR